MTSHNKAQLSLNRRLIHTIFPFSSMFVKPDEGLLYFLLYKSTHVVSAYKQAKEIVVSVRVFKNCC